MSRGSSAETAPLRKFTKKELRHLLLSGGETDSGNEPETLPHADYRDEETFLEQPIKIGPLAIHPLTSNHDEEAWQEHGDWLLEQVNKFSVIIPEYFPPEYDHLPEESIIYDYLLSQYTDHNIVFNILAPKFIKEGKDLWLVDPAYNQDFMKLRAIFQGGISAPPGLAAAAVGNDVINRSEIKMSRRSFAIRFGIFSAYLGFVIGGILTFAGEEGAVEIPVFHKHAALYLQIERDIRRVLIAEALVQLGEQLSKPQDMLLMYPKGHMEVIKHYLQDQDDRQLRYGFYSKLLKEAGLESLLTIRHYPKGNLDNLIHY